MGEGRHDEAAQDAIAIIRLSAHFAKGPYLVDQVVANTVGGIGLSVINRIVDDAATPSDTLKSLLGGLASTGPSTQLAHSLDVGERYYGLNAALSGRSICDSTGDFEDAAILLGADDGLKQRIKALLRCSVDWNPVLETCNEIFDRYVAAVNAAIPRDRMAQAEQIEADYSSRAVATPTWTQWLTAQGRGRIAADAWQAYFGSSMAICIAAQERFRIQRAITQLAIAIAIWRAENGAPPDDLDALVPGILAEISRDPFGEGEPLRYRRTDDGFLIWSVGLNGRDDGGSRNDTYFGGKAYEGVEIDSWLDPTSNDLSPQEKQAIDLMEKIPEDADDPSLRFPLPVAPWPWEDIGL